MSRRTLAHGLTWAVPVIGVAAAAPAFATSTCPEITAAETYVNTTTDKITLTNKAVPNSVTIPAGTTLTWQFANTSSVTASVTFTVTGATSATTSFTALAGATVSVTFTTSTAWAPGTTGPIITYSTTNSASASWNYRSRLTVSGFPSPISACPTASACTSIQGSTPGTLCPSAAAPAAGTQLRAPMPADPNAARIPTNPLTERQPPPGWSPTP